MRLVIAGGGTGGHLFPGLATARALVSESPGTEVLFVGTDHGIEARVIPGTEFRLRCIRARGLRRTGLLTRIKALGALPVGLAQSLSILREFKPDAALGVGGYASGPLLAAALLLSIPSAVQEQNSVMGTTNRLLCGRVDRVFTSWADTKPAPPPHHTTLAGNPVREDLAAPIDRTRSDDRFHVLVFGGSQGARALNSAIIQGLSLFAAQGDTIEFHHQADRGEVERLRAAYSDAGVRAEVVDFIYDMRNAYAWADVAFCRAGAGTLAELTALGKPAVVVPYPFAVDDHQTRNARLLENEGAVKVLEEAHLTPGEAAKELLRLRSHPDELAAMRENSKRMGKPDAARRIARELLAMVGQGPCVSANPEARRSRR